VDFIKHIHEFIHNGIQIVPTSFELLKIFVTIWA